ncbi:ArsR/SmtB family transcription factor [Nocardioides sp. Soil796]|uniref:ArsR/SmtB family transcription factor n=1 Tax=Nocardioides sp. Soil796 TaxID=1736412 RepID=UPI0007108D97|nr:helix-turn-helix domain-containing protein [Nocardioides sp. Soil796]
MMVYEARDSDLSALRFGVSPLSELCLSLRVLRAPTTYPVPAGWHAHVARQVGDLDLELLTALVNQRLGTPDFLNPRPELPLPRLCDELQTVATLPADAIELDLEDLWPENRPEVLRGPMPALRGRILAQVQAYWDRCFSPFWPAFRSVLRADIRHRSTQIADHGLRHMLDALTPSLTFDGTRLACDNRVGTSYEAAIAGRGLVLVPSLFTLNISYPAVARSSPTLIYPARGHGNLHTLTARADDHLTALVGDVRAQLLSTLSEPRTTKELALLLGKTSSAVNQQLRSLTAAGLLDTTRDGRSVLYGLSDLGSRLVRPT